MEEVVPCVAPALGEVDLRGDLDLVITLARVSTEGRVVQIEDSKLRTRSCSARILTSEPGSVSDEDAGDTVRSVAGDITAACTGV